MMGLSCVFMMTFNPGCDLQGNNWPEANMLPVRPELPNPLIAFDGSPIGDVDSWATKRRPELISLFQHYMYGYLPPARKVAVKELFRVASQHVELREWELTVDGAEDNPVHMLIALPADRKAPVPILLGLNFCGNHCLTGEKKVRVPTVWCYDKYPGVQKNRASEAGRGKQKEVFPIDDIVRRGYGLATIYNGEWEPDEKISRGGLFPKIPAVGPKGAHWGRIALWAWGLHRAVDVLTKIPEIDAKKIAVVGHSRLGKTALLAAALDERISLVIPSQAGCGGTAPSRGTIGESVERINTVFPNWFCDNFKKFNREPQRLPFDQNGLVALCAPRPVLFSNAEKDDWANPNGQFEVLLAAEPAYKLLGTNGLETGVRPPLGQLSKGRLGYFIRSGVHSMNRTDWNAFLDFADHHWR
jgi:hypothetical protein